MSVEPEYYSDTSGRLFVMECEPLGVVLKDDVLRVEISGAAGLPASHSRYSDLIVRKESELSQDIVSRLKEAYWSSIELLEDRLGD